MIGSSAFWIMPDGFIQDIGLSSHIEFVIKNPTMFNTTKNEIISLYAKYDEQIPVEGVARKIIIMGLLPKGYIRIRQYRNHWSISLSKLDTQSKSSLAKWAELAITIPSSGKYADVLIQTIDGNKFNYSVDDLNSN